MSKKIVEFLVGLLPSLKKLIRIPHFSEAESVFKLIYVKIKSAAPSDVVLMISSFFACVAAVAMFLFVLSLFSL